MFSCEREGALGNQSLEIETFSARKGKNPSPPLPAHVRPSYLPPARPGRAASSCRLPPRPSPRVARSPGTGAAARSPRAAGRAGRAVLTAS